MAPSTSIIAAALKSKGLRRAVSATVCRLSGRSSALTDRDSGSTQSEVRGSLIDVDILNVVGAFVPWPRRGKKH